jgi:RNA polymerase sigma-70 factor (ECF subfamily)
LEASPPTPDPQFATAVETTDVERLFREHNSALLRFIAAKIGSEQEAREIAQEAYVHLLQLNHPEAVSYLRAYLFKTASNLAVDRLRQRGRRTHVTSVAELDFAVFELSPERQVSGEQRLALIESAVAQLPAKCRQAFLLHRIDEVSIEDIAGRMAIGACMVRRYIARALEHVRHQLDIADQVEAAPGDAGRRT